MDHKGLRILLVAHGFITLAAGIVLAVAPSLFQALSEFICVRMRRCGDMLEG
jgi:hypothetical protein